MTMSFDFHRIERIEISETNSHAGDVPFHCRDLVIHHRDHLDALVETKFGLYTYAGEAALEVQANLEEFKDACDELEWVKAELEDARAEIRRLNERLESLGVIEI